MKATTLPSWLTILLSASFSLLHAQSNISLSRLSGDIKFIAPSADVQSRLAIDPPVAGGLVSATNLQSGQQSSAAYSVDAAGLPSILGHYALTPDVGPDGATFNVFADPVFWASGGNYRFGSTDGNSLSAHRTSEVATAGHEVVFDLAECPALCNGRIRLCGDQSMVDQIVGNVTLRLAADVRSGNTFSQQARSAPITATVAQLRGNGIVVPLVFRGGATVRFSGVATVTRAIVNVQQSFTFTSEPLAVACGETINIDVCPPVEFPPLGTLQGKADLVGAGLFQGSISHSPSFGGGASGSLPLSNLLGPPFPWVFPLLDSGSKNVNATVVSADKLRRVIFPRVQDVVVADGQTTDLGNTLVVKPFTVHVDVTLRDPAPGSSLVNISVRPFDQVGTFRPRPIMSFSALSGFATLPDGSQGVDGGGGFADVVLQGNFDPTSGQAELTGDALLAGLNTRTGNTDGSGALPANWKVGSLALGFANTQPTALYTSEDVVITLRNAQTFLSLPGGEARMASADICFGEFRRTLHCPTNKIFSPGNSVSSSSASPGLDDLGQPLDYSGITASSSGGPANGFDAVNNLLTGMTLPAFRSYAVTTTLAIRPASGSGPATLAQLQPFQTGSLECGELIEVDTTIDPTGQVTAELRLALETADEYCDPASVVVGLRGEATNTEILRAEVKLGTGPFVTVCGGSTNIPCSNPLVFDYQFPGQVPIGQQIVEARITDGAGHIARARKMIRVKPVQPVLHCPAPFTVFAERGLTTVPRATIAARLVAGFDFGCASPPATVSPIANNAPDILPLGPTDVTFSTPDDGSPTGNLHCVTTVTVERSGDCASLEDHAPGDLSAPETISGAVFSRSAVLEPKSARFAVQTAPPPLGQFSSLLVSGGVLVKLPFPCKRFFITYVKGNSRTFTVLGSNSSVLPRFGDGVEALDFRNPVFRWTSPADEPEARRRTKIILSEKSVTRLRISGAENELMLLRLCYQRG